MSTHNTFSWRNKKKKESMFFGYQKSALSGAMDLLYLSQQSQQCKPTKWHGRRVKTQISLGIHPVWSESLLSA